MNKIIKGHRSNYEQSHLYSHWITSFNLDLPCFVKNHLVKECPDKDLIHYLLAQGFPQNISSALHRLNCSKGYCNQKGQKKYILWLQLTLSQHRQKQKTNKKLKPNDYVKKKILYNFLTTTLCHIRYATFMTSGYGRRNDFHMSRLTNQLIPPMSYIWNLLTIPI